MRRKLSVIVLTCFLSFQLNYPYSLYGSSSLAPPARTELTVKSQMNPSRFDTAVINLSYKDLRPDTLVTILDYFDSELRKTSQNNFGSLSAICTSVVSSVFTDFTIQNSTSEDDHYKIYSAIADKYIFAKNDNSADLADYYAGLLSKIVFINSVAFKMIVESMAEDGTILPIYKDLLSALFSEGGMFDEQEFTVAMLGYVESLGENLSDKSKQKALIQILMWFSKLADEQNIDEVGVSIENAGKGELLIRYARVEGKNSEILKFASLKNKQYLAPTAAKLFNFSKSIPVKAIIIFALVPLFVTILLPALFSLVKMNLISDLGFVSDLEIFAKPAFGSEKLTKTLPSELPSPSAIREGLNKWEDRINNTPTGLPPSHIGDTTPAAVAHGIAAGGFSYDIAHMAIRNLILDRDYEDARKYMLYFAERFVQFSVDELKGLADENNVYGIIRLLPSPSDGKFRKHIINCVDTTSTWSEGNGVVEWYTDGGPQSFLLMAAVQTLQHDENLSFEQRAVLEQFVQELAQTILGLFNPENIVSAGPALQDINGAPEREHLGHIENMHDHYSALHQLASYLENNKINPELAANCRQKADSIHPELKKRNALVKKGDTAYFYQGFKDGKLNLQIPVDVQSWGILSATTRANAEAIYSLGPEKINDVYGDGSAEGIMKWLIRNALVLTDYTRPDGYEVTTLGFDFSDPHLTDIKAQRGGKAAGQITDEWTAGVICAMDVMASYYYDIGNTPEAERLLAMADALRYFAYARAVDSGGELYWEYSTVHGLATGYGWFTPSAPGGSGAGSWMLFALDHRGNPFDPEGLSLKNIPSIKRLGIKSGIELLLKNMKKENKFSKKSPTLPGTKIVKTVSKVRAEGFKDGHIPLVDPSILKQIKYYSAIGENKGLKGGISPSMIRIETVASWNNVELSFTKMQNLSNTPLLKFRVMGKSGAKAVRVNIVDEAYIQAQNWSVPPSSVLAEIPSEGEWHEVIINLNESAADISMVRAISFDVGTDVGNQTGAETSLTDCYFEKNNSGFSIPKTGITGKLSELFAKGVNKDDKPFVDNDISKPITQAPDNQQKHINVNGIWSRNYGGDWESIDLHTEVDFSPYRTATFNIEATDEMQIRIQMLDKNARPGDEYGLTQRIKLKKGLNRINVDLKELDVDLSTVYLIIINYGKQEWGRPLNPDGGSISVKEPFSISTASNDAHFVSGENNSEADKFLGRINWAFKNQAAVASDIFEVDDVDDIIEKTPYSVLVEAVGYSKPDILERCPDLPIDELKGRIRVEIVNRLSHREIDKPLRKKTIYGLCDVLQDSLPNNFNIGEFKENMQNYEYSPDLIVSDILRSGRLDLSLLLQLFNKINNTLVESDFPEEEYDRVVAKTVLLMARQFSSYNKPLVAPIDLAMLNHLSL